MKKFLSLVLSLSFLLIFSFAGCDSTQDKLKSVVANANSYQIDATLGDDMMSLTASEVVNYTNKTGCQLQQLKFHLHPNAFSELAKEHKAISENQEKDAFFDGASYGSIDILEVKCLNESKNFTLSNENQILSVDLGGILPTNAQIALTLNFSVILPKVNHRFGVGKDTINLGNWFPILCVFENENWNTDCYNSSGDPFYSQVANFEVSLTYPNNLILASTGNLCFESEKNETKTTTFKAEAVRDFAMILSSKFQVLTQNVDKTQVNYFYFDDQTPEKHLKTCVDALKTFNEMFGSYPYKTLNVAKANFLHGGMEFPNLVFVSSSIENEPELNNVIVHEIAHQWWYGVVGNNQQTCAWIDEGLAEFSTALFYEKTLVMILRMNKLFQML